MTAKVGLAGALALTSCSEPRDTTDGAAIHRTFESAEIRPQLLWLNEHRNEVLDRFMPIPREQPDAGPWQSAGSPVAFRSYRDLYLTIDEEYFRFDEQPPGLLIATLVTPIDKSIQRQILELRLGSPSASLNSLLGGVKVETVVLDERECPAVRLQFEAVKILNFAAPKWSGQDHPEVYWIYIETSGGRFRSLMTDGDHPLRQWATETLKRLRECTSDERAQ